jgi:hypothetical protein
MFCIIFLGRSVFVRNFYTYFHMPQFGNLFITIILKTKYVYVCVCVCVYVLCMTVISAVKRTTPTEVAPCKFHDTTLVLRMSVPPQLC